MQSAKAPRTRRPTSADVAAHAGVSRSTVSQVFNGLPGFPEQTRQKVMAAADEIGYRPSTIGRALVFGVSDLVLVVVPNTTYGTNLQDLLDAITQRAEERGRSVLVRFAAPGDAGAAAMILDLRPATVIDFGIFTPAQRAKILEAGTRVVPSSPNPNETDMLRPFNAAIAQLQVNELVRHGKTRLAYVSLADGRIDVYGPSRRKAAEQEASKRGLPSLIHASLELSLDSAGSALEHLLEASDGEPIGVCCYNDDVAMALVSAAISSGRKVPGDVSIVGVDHSKLGQLFMPRLTTVRVTDQLALPIVRYFEMRDEESEPFSFLDAPPSSPLVELVEGETT